MKNLTRVVFYLSFPLSFIAFIFPIYARNLGSSVIEIGYLYALFSIITLITKPLIGKLIDKRGRKLSLIIGVILYLIVNFLYIVSSNLTHLLIIRVFQGFAASFLWISVNTIVSDLSDEKTRGENFGIIGQTQVRGEFIGSTIGFIFILYNSMMKSLNDVFIIYFIFNIIALFIAVKSVKETKVVKKVEDTSFRNSKFLIIFFVIIGFIALISSITAPIYLIYLSDYITNDLGLIVLLFVPGSILATFLPKKFGAFADKHAKLPIIFLGLFINAVMQIFIPFITEYYPFMFFYTLLNVVNMFYAPALSAIIIEFLGENRRGKSYSLYSLATGIGGSIGPLIGTFLYQNVNSSSVFFVKSILLLIIVVVIYLINLIYKNRVQKNIL